MDAILKFVIFLLVVEGVGAFSVMGHGSKGMVSSTLTLKTRISKGVSILQILETVHFDVLSSFRPFSFGLKTVCSPGVYFP